MVHEVESHGFFPCLPCLTSYDGTHASLQVNDSRVLRRPIYNPGLGHTCRDTSPSTRDRVLHGSVAGCCAQHECCRRSCSRSRQRWVVPRTSRVVAVCSRCGSMANALVAHGAGTVPRAEGSQAARPESRRSRQGPGALGDTIRCRREDSVPSRRWVGGWHRPFSAGETSSKSGGRIPDRSRTDRASRLPRDLDR